MHHKQDGYRISVAYLIFCFGTTLSREVASKTIIFHVWNVKAQLFGLK